MSKKAYSINEFNIHNYTTSDAELVLQECKLNKDGFPAVWPTKNNKNQRVVLSFVNAIICDSKGQKLSDEQANFDILEEDVFKQDEENAETKVKYISALLTPDYLVDGGVYYKGRYFTRKMAPKKALFLIKDFLHKYFRIEDGPFLRKYFLNNEETHLPFWPTKTRDNVKAVFSAVDATIKDAKTGEQIGDVYNFDMYWGDTLDLNNADDQLKAEVIRSITDENRIVDGFYYKGNLIEGKLTKEFRLYLQKTFVKRNFTVNQREFLEGYVAKDPKNNLPVFWPMKDKDEREIVISVVNASAAWLEDDSLKNFDVYTDTPFDVSKEEFINKIDVIRAMYYGTKPIQGALYFDGILVNGTIEAREKDRRKDKVEKALKIYISDSTDFIEINKEYTIDDRERLINLSKVYDTYYPRSQKEVLNHWRNYKLNKDVALRFKRVNTIDKNGDYTSDEDFYLEVKEGEKITDPRALEILASLFNPNEKVRGALYFRGVNIGQKPIASLNKFKNEYLKEALSEEDFNKVTSCNEDEIKRFAVDKKYKMPFYWPTKDNNGRETLLSCVDCDVHFKVGRSIVRAVNNATFDIYVGEVFGLVGESGSGKTTISRAILGINKLTKGAIYFKGKLISNKLKKEESLKTKKNIQMIFQDPAASLNERANVDYIISEGLYNFHMFKSKEERLNKVVSMLDAVGLLPEHLSRYPHEFSGGQRQRIGIARALVIEPQLVLADEPISALDVSIRAQVLNLLKKLQNDQGLTYLFIAHDLSIIRYISDRIAVMHQGYIVELGPANEIYSHPLHPYTRSLLTAIPQPDPKTKDQRKKVPYQQGDLVYGECHWKEFRKDHFVLVNDKLEKDVKNRIAKIGKDE